MNCKCFRCGTGYDSTNEDDIVGDGKCPPCQELSKKAAFKVDIDMGNKRRDTTPSLIRQIFTEEQIQQGLSLDDAGRIIGGTLAKPATLKDLGITPSD